MTVVHTENFDSTTVGTLPASWTSLDGSTWQVTNTHSLSSPNGLIGPTPSGDGKIIFYQGGSALPAMDVRYDIFEVASAGDVGVILQADASYQNAYVIIADSGGTINGTWDVYARNSGSYNKIDSFTVSGVTAPGNLSIRARYKSGVVYFKIWAYGTSEPSTWTHQTSDTSVTNSGFAGFYYQGQSGSSTTGCVVDNFVLDDTTTGTLTAGTSSSSGITSTAATVTNAGASGGTSPYGYQWYRSTTSGFTPGAGNIVSGATSLTLNDSGLSPSTTYYYVNVVTDSISATAVSAQLSVTTASASLTNGSLTAPSIGSTTATVVDSGATGGTSPYTYQWYRSTTSGFTPGAGNMLSGATSLTLNDTGLTPSTTYYYKNIVTDHVGATAVSSQISFTTTAGIGLISVTNSGLFWSKANWDHLTVGTFGASVDTMQTTAPGAFVRGVFTNPATLNLLIDNSTTSGFPSGDMPFVRYSVNDAPYVDVQLAPGQTSIVIGSGWSTGNAYNVQIYLNGLSNTNGYSDVWGSGGVRPPNNLSLTGFTGDSGITVSLPTVLGGNMLVYSDSIGAGEHAWYNGSGTDDATSSWVVGFCRAMNCEPAAVCYGGQGMTVPGGSNMPALPTTYASYSSGRARSFSGVTAVALVQLGNDLRLGVSTSTAMAATAAFLPNLRAALPLTTPIYIIVECMGAYATDLSATVAAYKTSSGDNYTYFVDAMSLLPTGVFGVNFGGVGRYTYDQVHPLTAGHALIAPAFAKAVQSVIGTPTNSNTPTIQSHQLKRARS